MAVLAEVQAKCGKKGFMPIKVFATGGLGGVHKGAELSLDVSADLY